MTIYLQKANDNLVSHCSCGDGRISLPSQMDCPWCGCGWLFTCMTCRKAFTFAKVIKTDMSLFEIGWNDLEKSYGRKPTINEVGEWVDYMRLLLDNISGKGEFVYFDGRIIPVKSKKKMFTVMGMHSRHRFDQIPQYTALEDKSIIDELLINENYWLSTKRKKRRR